MEPFETSETSENSHFYAKSKVRFNFANPERTKLVVFYGVDAQG